MKISILPQVNSWSVTPVEYDDLLTELQSRGTDAAKYEAPLWSPIAYKGTSRRASDAVEVSAVVFDFDQGRPELPMLPKLQLCHYWHTTHSHTAEKPKWRLVIPLDKPVAAKEWAAFHAKTAELLEVYNYDRSCADLAQFYYVPPKSADWEAFPGKKLPVDEIAAYTPADTKALRVTLFKVSHPDQQLAIRNALAGKPLATPGNRRQTTVSLGYFLGKFVVNPPTPASVVVHQLSAGFDMPGNDREPTRPREYWVQLFREAFDRGREARKDSAPVDPDAWKAQLLTVTKLDGQVSIGNNPHNAALILQHEGTWSVRKNLLEGVLELWENFQWRGLTDSDCTKISNWLQKSFRINLSRQLVYDQLDLIATPYDPLVEYLDSLEWDGVQRLDSFLTEFFGCEDTPTTRLYSKHWLRALVARAARPGCKMDNVLVLQGTQGLGKSTALRTLTHPWFSDTKISIGDKDSLLIAARSWCHEFAELASLKKADLETYKAFFTSQQDTYRPPYGRATVTKPRRSVFVATTNETEFLTDSTGARRFWVARVVRQVDTEAIKRVRGLVLAEAYKELKEGAPYWLSTEEEQKAQEANTRDFQVEDGEVMQEQIVQWWDRKPKDATKPAYLTLHTVCTEILDIPVERVSVAMERKVKNVLKALGFVETRKLQEGQRRRLWAPPVSWFIAKAKDRVLV